MTNIYNIYLMCLIFYFLMTQNLSLLRKFQNKVMPQKFQYTKVHKKDDQRFGINISLFFFVLYWQNILFAKEP